MRQAMGIHDKVTVRGSPLVAQEIVDICDGSSLL
jgi:hypothetical protein